MKTKIIQITDCHLFKEQNKELYGIKTNRNFENVIRRVREEKPDCIFLTGDVSQDESRESYEVAANYLDNLKIPIYYVPGNHDNFQIMKKVFVTTNHISMPEQIHFLNWKILFLNSNMLNSPAGKLSQEELKKLEGFVNNNRKELLSIVMHHHPVEVSTPLIDNFILKNSYHFWQIIKPCKNLKLVICGHVHGDYTLKYDDYFIESGPASCFQFIKGTVDLKTDIKIGYKRYLFYDDGYSAEAIQWTP